MFDGFVTIGSAPVRPDSGFIANLLSLDCIDDRLRFMACSPSAIEAEDDDVDPLIKISGISLDLNQLFA